MHPYQIDEKYGPRVWEWYAGMWTPITGPALLEPIEGKYMAQFHCERGREHDRLYTILATMYDTIRWTQTEDQIAIMCYGSRQCAECLNPASEEDYLCVVCRDPKEFHEYP